MAHRISLPALALALASGCAPPAPPKRAEPPRDDAPKQRVYVTIDVTTDASPARASLIRERGDKDETACVSPCNRVLEVQDGGHFHIVSQGANPTKSFTLFSPHDRVAWIDYTARPLSIRRGLRIASLTSLIVGGVVVAGTFIAASILDDKDPAKKPVMITGAVGFFGVLPVGGILAGIASTFNNSKIDFKDPSKHPDLAIHF